MRLRSWLCAIAPLLLLNGCTKPVTPAQAAAKIKIVKPVKTELPGKLSGAGWHIPWFTRDPKNPNGPLIPVLIADAKHGEIMNTQTATLRLRDVHAKMYRNGIQSADIKAPQVTVNQGDWIFVGTGGVTVRSLADPPDTVITGDKVTWKVKSKELVAEGNAYIEHREKDGKLSTAHANRITFDTALKTSSFE